MIPTFLFALEKSRSKACGGCSDPLLHLQQNIASIVGTVKIRVVSPQTKEVCRDVKEPY